VLANERDLSAFKDNLTLLTSRIIRLYMPFFQKHVSTDSVPHHIEHQHSTKISSKLEVVRVICLFISCLLLAIISLDCVLIRFLHSILYIHNFFMQLPLGVMLKN